MIYLKDYLPPAFLISQAELNIDLTSAVTTVRSKLTVHRNPDSHERDRQIVLMGENLSLKQLKLDNKILSAPEYSTNPQTLTIPNVPESFTLEIITEIKPQDNTELSGLYKSAHMYCTQCEAEGFRRITYYLDRPDVMAKFKVTIHADKKEYPVLLANGNLIAAGADDELRHYATWEDPFAKPSYLFAMVAGDLLLIEDNFLTMSRSLVKLKLYIERENLDQSAHAMAALKKAMLWDEKVYGREYDLDAYMIVAVNDFNMGAMENKGLNIFNAKYVLASPATATDLDFQNIDSVIGHEYFHNWSGNRVTCRDWFQLSLKEGFTVFREQQFTQDITQSPVCRIEHVKLLMTRQFTEDSGPLAHPVRPDAYMEINNFYTMTIYEKGAEVIRMLHTLLGAEKFRAGTDLYFKRHDGQAVTTDDFVAAMAEVSGIDLTQFKLWYTQAGTPEIKVTESYDKAKQLYILHLQQHTAPTPGQATKQALHIPVAIGLLDEDGKDIPINNTVLSLSKSEESFVFENIPVQPKLSILRNFSAPVKIKHEVAQEELAFMLAHDSDDFNRWFAGQKLYTQYILDLVEDLRQKRKPKLSELILKSFKAVLLDPHLNLSLKAELISMPSTVQLIDVMHPADPDLIYAAKKFVVTSLARKLNAELLQQYSKHQLQGNYNYNAKDVSYRTFKNIILAYLLSNQTPEGIQLAVDQYYSANNMTDIMAAMSTLVNIDCTERAQILAEFYAKWSYNPLVINKWLAVQAQADSENTLQEVQRLMQHQSFDLKNPNKVQALIAGFCVGNPVRFHATSGAGYEFLTEIVLQLNKLNPQVAARMLNPLSQWQKFTVDRQKLMCAQLLRIKQTDNLSLDVLELVTKTLDNYVCE